MKVKHYIVKETGDPAVDRTDVVDRGWGELWIDFSKDPSDAEPIGGRSLMVSEMRRSEHHVLELQVDQAQVDRTAAGHRPPDTVIGVASLAKSEILYECEVWAVAH